MNFTSIGAIPIELINLVLFKVLQTTHIATPGPDS
jgi:hypothetical protein